MKKKRIEGRCYKKRTQKGVFRMRKKSRECLRMERYARTLAYIASEDDYATERMIETIKSIIKERGEALTVDDSFRGSPGVNPAVWYGKE
jgi:hypothetical protein